MRRSRSAAGEWDSEEAYGDRDAVEVDGVHVGEETPGGAVPPVLIEEVGEGRVEEPPQDMAPPAAEVAEKLESETKVEETLEGMSPLVAAVEDVIEGKVEETLQGLAPPVAAVEETIEGRVEEAFEGVAPPVPDTIASEGKVDETPPSAAPPELQEKTEGAGEEARKAAAPPAEEAKEMASRQTEV